MTHTNLSAFRRAGSLSGYSGSKPYQQALSPRVVQPDGEVTPIANLQ